MIKHIYVTGLLFSLLTILSFGVVASDLGKEKRWADQVVDSILDGDAVWLNDGSHDFLGIFTETDTDTGKAVIIMHGTGVHPDWQQVVQPLRVNLIDHGWSTLSIQMPVLANEAEHEEYAPLYEEVASRIDAAIAYLKDNGAKKIVLLGHSQGASMAAYYLSQKQSDVNGFIAIGLSGLGKDSRMNGARSIEKINVPMFDLYGKEDLEEILATVAERADAAKKAGNAHYSQSMIPGNHFFDENEDGLVEAVASWLNRKQK